MVAPNIEATASSPSTEEHTQPKVADKPKDNQTEATDLKHKFNKYLNAEITTSGPSTKTENKPTKPKLADLAKNLVRSCLHHLTDKNTNKYDDPTAVTIKTYPCDYDCTGAEVSEHPPLTLVLPATPNLMQHVACLATLTRHVHTWLPHEAASLTISQKLNEAAQETFTLHSQCVWLVNEQLPRVCQLTDDTAPLLREMAGLLKEQPLDEGGWEKAPGKLWRAWEAIRVCAEPRAWVGIEVANHVRRLAELQVKRLMAIVPEVMRELESLSENTDTWRGCRTCAGHAILVLRDIIDWLQEIERIVRDGMVEVLGVGLLLKPSGPYRSLRTARQFREAAKKADSRSQQIRELISRVQRWSEVIEFVELGGVMVEGNETQDEIGGEL